MVEERNGGGGDELRELVRQLGSTDGATRKSGLQSFSGFLKREELDAPAMLKLWRGLFYGLWYTPGYQAQMEWVTEMCRGILDQTHHVALLFWKSFLLTICTEWKGLDKYRLDKYYLLARHILRAMIVKMGFNNWEGSLDFMNALHECVFPDEMTNAPGLGYHFAEIFLAEVWEAARTAGGLPTMSKKHHKRLLSGFAQILTSDFQSDVLKRKIREEIFDVLEEIVNGEPIHPPFGPTLAKDLKKLLSEAKEASAEVHDTAVEVAAVVQLSERKSRKEKQKADLGPTKKISKHSSKKKKKAVLCQREK